MGGAVRELDPHLRTWDVIVTVLLIRQEKAGPECVIQGLGGEGAHRGMEGGMVGGPSCFASLASCAQSTLTSLNNCSPSTR